MRSSKPWFKIDESGVLWGMKLLFGVYRLFGRWLFAVLLHPIIAYYLLTNATARQASREYLRRLADFELCMPGDSRKMFPAGRAGHA